MTNGSLLVRGGDVVGPNCTVRQDVLIDDARVVKVGLGLEAPKGVDELDVTGKLVFPGLVDPQVHFREPGLEHK